MSPALLIGSLALSLSPAAHAAAPRAAGAAAPALQDGTADTERHADIDSFGAMARPDAPAIINGEDASADDYPMTGGLLVNGTLELDGFGSYPLTDMFICSSTLIAPDVVLTAAHCVDPYALTYGYGDLLDGSYGWTTEADLTMYDGTADRDLPAGSGTSFDWTMHPDWNMNALGMGLAQNSDIALVFLAEPLLDVQPAILPTAEEAAAIEEGLEVVVVGWGQQSATDMWETPPAGSIQIKQMGTSHVAEVADYEFQVGKVESDVRKCHVDSGGPSFAMIGEGDEPMRLVGVTSHAYDTTDCFETGGVDTRVDFYLEWIDAEMRARCEDGTRSWCDEPGLLTPDYYAGTSGGDEGTDGTDGTDGIDDGSTGTDDAAEASEDEDAKAGCSALGLGAAGLTALLALGAVLRRRED